MALTIGLEAGRAAFVASVASFLDAVAECSESELLGGSRCHGWSRLDVVTHVLAGWQEMLGGLVSPTDQRPDVDAASYWTAFAAETGDEDPVEVLLAQRRRSDAYRRPASAVAQLRDVAAAVVSGAQGLGEGSVGWQGHVFAAGDFLAVWAVEVAVHQLDLLVLEPAPDDALALTRATAEALLGEPFPEEWSDEHVALVATGRVPEPLWEHEERLPLLG